MVLEDRRAASVAVVAAVGALHPWRPGLGVAVGVAVVAAAMAAPGRRPWLLVLAVGLATSGLAQRSLDGLDGVEPATVAADVVLLGDPVPSFGGLRVDVRLDGRRLEARADGSAVAALEPRLAGEVVRVRGALTSAPGDQPWLVARHVSGRLRIHRVEGWRPGDPVARVANGLRRTLEAGAAGLGERDRSLFTGLVIGDDRAQPADLADDFLGAGLTHLLAVSGQNVGFALALAGPLLRRLRLWPRLLVTLGVIGLFGVMTRFEPSVLRASAMAALAATLAIGGSSVSRLQVIGLAVAGLLLIDPLLVRAVGFQLSVAAAVAIVVVAPAVTRALPGPAALREAMAVTIAAQLGVAPVLLATFGPIPVASLPANLLAVPVAGAVMVWGLTAGMAAGVGGGPLATIVHVPTRLALGWLEVVADRSAHAPLGELRLPHLVAAAVGLTVAVRRPRHRRAGLVLAAGALLVATLAAQAPAPLRSAPMTGLVRWHGRGADVVVLGGVGGRTSLDSRSVLEALRRAGVGPVDLLVVADPSVSEAVVDAVVASHPAGAVVGASDVPRAGAVVDVGGLTVRLVVVPGRVVVDAIPRGP